MSGRRLLAAAVVAAVLVSASAFLRPGLQQLGFAFSDGETVGRAVLERRLGSHAPRGEGVVVMLCEAPDKGGWMPERTAGALRGVRIEAIGGTGGPSGHATMTAAAIVSIAPSVSAILSCSSQWFLEEFLRSGRDAPPRRLPRQVGVLCFPWVGSAGAADREVLQRLDLVLAGGDGLAVAGQRPGSRLLASSYNAISAGSEGSQSRGTDETLDGGGRCKPEIVGPDAASRVTAWVAGAAALLLDAADRLPSLRTHAAARRNETIRAALLAGAVRAGDWSNLPDGSTTSLADSTSVPLDRGSGAGRVDPNRAHLVLTGGFHPAGAAAAGGSRGWSFLPAEAEAETSWRIDLPEGVGEFAIVACWNRQFREGGLEWSLADFDLSIRRVGGIDAAAAGGGEATAFARSGNLASASRVDNLEMILLRGVRPGRYEVALRRREGAVAPVAVAWLASGPFRDPAAEPTAAGAGDR